MSILLMGGSFNPIHICHLLCARYALEENFNQVIFIPCGDAPHKTNLVTYHHRLNMIHEAFIRENPEYFDYSSIEGQWAKEGKKSYTINTYRYFKEKYKNDDIWWFIGSDNVRDLKTWHNFEAIKKEMQFAIAERPSAFSISKQSLEIYDLIKYRFIKSPNLQISSTDIRERIKKGLSIRYLVPDSVEAYIKENKLYL